MFYLHCGLPDLDPAPSLLLSWHRLDRSFWFCHHIIVPSILVFYMMKKSSSSRIKEQPQTRKTRTVKKKGNEHDNRKASKQLWPPHMRLPSYSEYIAKRASLHYKKAQLFLKKQRYVHRELTTYRFSVGLRDFRLTKGIKVIDLQDEGMRETETEKWEMWYQSS